MHKVTVTTRSRNFDLPAFEHEGFVPYPDSPLAVTREAEYYETEGWTECKAWIITHRPSGFMLGDYSADTKAEALAMLARCDPTFPAWRFVSGLVEDSALMACRAKYRAAQNEQTNIG